MVGAQSVLDGMVRTFGPFLIPVTVFAIGVVGYTVLFLLSRQFRPEEEAGVVNLSAGTPDRSTTDRDHGASTRGVLPYGGDEGTAGGDASGDVDSEDGSRVQGDSDEDADRADADQSDTDRSDADHADTDRSVTNGEGDRVEDTARHND